MRSVLIAIVAVVMSACAAPASEQAADFIGVDGKPLVMAGGVIDNAVQQALTDDPAACAKVGGELKPVCRMQMPICLIAFKDAGKSCTDGAQCASGRCKVEMSAPDAPPATSGQCAANNDPCGCFQLMEDGVAQAALCAD